MLYKYKIKFGFYEQLDQSRPFILKVDTRDHTCDIEEREKERKTKYSEEIHLGIYQLK